MFVISCRLNVEVLMIFQTSSEGLVKDTAVIYPKRE